MSPPVKVQGVWMLLIADAGSVTALARELRTSRSTLYRWMRGALIPDLRIQQWVNKWASEGGLPVPFAAPKAARHSFK